MIKFIELWLVEFIKAIGKLFLNPLLYWSILLVFMTGYSRIKRERSDFGSKIFDVFSEWKNTWILSIGLGIFISLLAVSVGIVFSYEAMLVLSIVTIILSLTFKLTMLSASYTMGITYLLLLLAPFLLKYQTFIAPDLFSQINFTGFVLLLSLFLIVEALLLRRVTDKETYPELTVSKRGFWIGQHRLKKLSVLPLFILVPNGLIAPFIPFWPHFTLGGESYSLLLIPFLIGFDHIVRGGLASDAAKKLAKSIGLLSIIVLGLAIGSIYISWLSLVAVFIAIVGREYINYRHRTLDKASAAYFNQLDKGLKVLAVIPGTPADRLHILIGETITRVNNQRIYTTDDFYKALQTSEASFRLDVIDSQNEVRFLQSAIYEDDHHELGIIFTERPHINKQI